MSFWMNAWSSFQSHKFAKWQAILYFHWVCVKSMTTCIMKWRLQFGETCGREGCWQTLPRTASEGAHISWIWTHSICNGDQTPNRFYANRIMKFGENACSKRKKKKLSNWSVEIRNNCLNPMSHIASSIPYSRKRWPREIHPNAWGRWTCTCSQNVLPHTRSNHKLLDLPHFILVYTVHLTVDLEFPVESYMHKANALQLPPLSNPCTTMHSYGDVSIRPRWDKEPCTTDVSM